MKSLSLNGKQFRIGIIFVLLFSLLLSFGLSSAFSIPAYAKNNDKDIYEDRQSLAELGSTIDNSISDNEYQSSSGSYIKGKDLLEKSGDVSYGDINEKRFNMLTNEEKKRFVNDMVNVVDDKISSDKANGVTGVSAVSEDTKATWLQNLQNCNGIGSQLMNNILSQTKPDFVKAQRIWAPFASPLGTVLGLLSILIGAGITLSMAIDLAWIAVPFFRGFGNDEGGDAKRPWFISFEAFSSVRDAEQNSDGKTTKIAVLLYFKKRVVMLVVLGICLLYLVQGEIFTFVSMILDLVSGFLGF